MNIGLLGFGVVGGGVWELAAGRQDVNVTRVLVRRPKEGLPAAVATTDVNDILGDDAIDTVVVHDGKKYRIVDTAGLRRKSQIDDAAQGREHIGYLDTIVTTGGDGG